MSLRLPGLIAAILLWVPMLSAAKWNNTYELESWAVRESYDLDPIDKAFVQNSGIARAEARFRMRAKWFTFAVDPQLRVLGNQFETATPLAKQLYAASIRAPDRPLGLESQVWTSEGSQAQASLERLTIGAKTQNFEFLIGRQPISLGVMKFVPVWNRFVVNLPVPGVFLQFPNRDSLSFRYSGDSWGLNAYSIFAKNSDQNAYLLDGSVSFAGSELRVLGGNWEKRTAGGMAMTTTILDAIFKAEYLATGIGSKEFDLMQQLGLGVETAFNANLSLNIENLFLSGGATDKTYYDIRTLNQFRPLLGVNYTIFSLKYDGESFWSVSPQAIVNFSDHSMILGGDVNYSLGDHSEISLQLRWPTGSSGDEFSAVASPLGSFGPFGVAQQVFAKYRLTY